MNHQSNRQSFCAGVSHPPPRRAKPADGATRWLRKDAWAPRKKRSEMPMSRYVDESSACSAWQCKSKIKPHFVQGGSGDIHQQWLRDSSNQMRVYIPLAKASKPSLQEMLLPDNASQMAWEQHCVDRIRPVLQSCARRAGCTSREPLQLHDAAHPFQLRGHG